jgi:hypothetical protein
MNLSYTLPKAEANIIAGLKLHTFRQDRGNRWKPGLLIHHSYSFRSKGGYSCFLLNTCTGVQKILIVLDINNVVHIRVDRRKLHIIEILQLIKNDGFEKLCDFVDWFFPANKKGIRRTTIFSGKIIHWTNLKY